MSTSTSDGKKILSAKRHKDIQDKKEHKQARSDMEILTDVLWETQDQLDDTQLRGSPYAISGMQEARRNCFALSPKRHLANYKVLGTKFLQLYTKKNRPIAATTHLARGHGGRRDTA